MVTFTVLPLYENIYNKLRLLISAEATENVPNSKINTGPAQ
jgi:hypothetical protein